MSDASPDALVYIAYARADRARVAPVVAALRAHGVNVAFDERTHGAGNYVQESHEALRAASALVVFYSQAAAQSPWVEAETRTFTSRMANGGRMLISVRLDDTPLPPSLGPAMALSAQGASPAALASELAGTLTGQAAQGAPTPDPAPSPALSPDPPSEPDYAPYDEEAEQVRGFGDLSDSTFDRAVGVAPDWLPDEEPAAEAVTKTVGPAEAAPPAPPPPQPYTEPIVIERGALTGAPATQPAQPRGPQPATLEQVTFTAYHPREMQPQQWQPLVVYISLNNPAAMAMVAAAAAERLAGKLDQFRPGRSGKPAGLARGAKLRIVPSAPGFQFNPSFLDVTWQEDVQQHDFRMRAESATPGQAVNGVVQFYQGMLLRAEVPFSVFVGQAVARLDSPDAYQQAIARAYRRIFAAYSHADTPVVESCETAARTMGDQYLRDVNLLQSGSEWDPRLIQAINDADIFQLFWSKRAAASPYVEREWRHALRLMPTRPNFIRPVFWSRHLYPTPAELNPLHFQSLSLSSMGWGWLRTKFYEMRNG